MVEFIYSDFSGTVASGFDIRIQPTPNPTDPHPSQEGSQQGKSDRGAVGLATYVFLTGIRATLQKHFALKGGGLDPIILVRFFWVSLLSTQPTFLG
ncbi:hypothetical protein [Okeania sp. SIO2C2]|uniref:hypothetical protein n=1 Tax=Okeania sp. SIO2C2 TaxID=2607787 RepID=UPI0025800363|nr:hypothetical protein [Okeania sp. SIO2C2]